MLISVCVPNPDGARRRFSGALRNLFTGGRRCGGFGATPPAVGVGRRRLCALARVETLRVPYNVQSKTVYVVFLGGGVKLRREWTRVILLRPHLSILCDISCLGVVFS